MFKRKVLVNFGIIAGCILVGGIALYFLSANLASTSAAVANDQTLLQQQTDALGVLASLKADAPQAAAYQTKLEKLLPSQYKLITFNDALTAVARLNGVAATYSFQGNPTPPANGTVGRAPFSLTVEGPGSQVTSFLKDLEFTNPGFLLSLDSFELSTEEGNTKVVAQGTLFFQ